jgi:hypothetical protein
MAPSNYQTLALHAGTHIARTLLDLLPEMGELVGQDLSDPGLTAKIKFKRARPSATGDAPFELEISYAPSGMIPKHKHPLAWIQEGPETNQMSLFTEEQMAIAAAQGQQAPAQPQQQMPPPPQQHEVMPPQPQQPAPLPAGWAYDQFGRAVPVAIPQPGAPTYAPQPGPYASPPQPPGSKPTVGSTEFAPRRSLADEGGVY